MDRPALKQLLNDVKSNRVDIIVVYKVDRLTRSLADFAKIVEILDENEASFVSVTQSFNTTNSMGRLTLNVLLSFAQFEREVTGERIRDKIAASKKKGMWMGGPVPIGYDLGDRRLVINEEEAKTVRHIFKRYAKLKSVPKLVEKLAAQGVRTKRRSYKDGRTIGGIKFGRGPLTALLQNPIYAGKVRHGDELYDGEHEAIIGQQMFEKVQNIFAANRRDKALGKKSRNPSLLTGMITDPDGRPMTPCHTTKGSRRYRYYMTRFRPGETTSQPWRLPAGEIEWLVINALVDHLAEPTKDKLSKAVELADSIARNGALAEQLPSMSAVEKRRQLLSLKTKVQVKQKAIKITIHGQAADEPSVISVDAKLVSRGSELKLAVAPSQGSAKRDPDPVLLRLIAQAFAARDHKMHGKPEPMVADYSKRYLHQLVRISYLAPDIISAILAGTQPPDLTGRKLLRAGNLPLSWDEQRTELGFK